MKHIYYILPITSSIQAVALWPIILANKSWKACGVPTHILRHEKIHHQQQLEMLVLPFYIWYSIEWLVRWLIYRDRKKAYREISLEKEAYANDGNPGYLQERKYWSFLNYF
ncbi:hypothetical protein GCM10023231_05950 [Olivibacter ginsenosidimutans]|uniref:Fatty acid hydroxylase domain-containing protein n=1 Tax=Olivibacter ginsenosidimutans TaxID=1176537 RepID=A0ABP9AGZ4_9SPHI